MIIVVGIPGSGKTSILTSVQKVLPTTQIINYGKKMLEAASLKEKDRDLLRKKPHQEQKKLGLITAQIIAKEATDVTIVDTHAFVRTPLGFCPGLPKEILEILNPKALVLITCSPSTIIQRRARDVDRARDVESAEELALHQELSQSYLSAGCLLTGAQFCIVRNDSDDVEKNATPLINLIKS